MTTPRSEGVSGMNPEALRPIKTPRRLVAPSPDFNGVNQLPGGVEEDDPRRDVEAQRSALRCMFCATIRWEILGGKSVG